MREESPCSTSYQHLLLFVFLIISILNSIPCALEKNVYSATFGWNILHISIKFIWSNVLFKANVSLLIFCLDDLSIDVSEVLKYLTVSHIIVNIFFNSW